MGLRLDEGDMGCCWLGRSCGNSSNRFVRL